MDKLGTQGKETIAVRGLPVGTRSALKALAEVTGRSFEAEARYAIKKHLANNANTNGSVPNEADHSSLAVRDAVRHVQQVTERRDSVKRKLDGGSAAITSADLQRIEIELTGARLKLGEQCPSHPLSLMHAMQP